MVWVDIQLVRPPLWPLLMSPKESDIASGWFPFIVIPITFSLLTVIHLYVYFLRLVLGSNNFCDIDNHRSRRSQRRTAGG
jgi:hypothetical protein